MATNQNDRFLRSRLRSAVSLFLVIAACSVALGAIGSSRAISQRVGGNPVNVADKIAPWVVAQTANGQQAEFFIVLADQADLSGAAALRTKNEKGRFVHDVLWNKSQTAQRPILRWLREHGVEHHSFYIVNAILVKGTREIAQTLAARPDVGRIEGNPHIQNDIPQPVSAVETTSQPTNPATSEPGFAYSHAA